MSYLPDRGRRRGATALAAAAVAGLLITAPAAAVDVYPPSLPGPTATTVPPDIAPTTAVLGTKVDSLAFSGTDVLPYLAGGGVLVIGGAALLVRARRRGDAQSD